ncbi:hypothetical protein [Mesorhizobium sp.]|uniref:hypothetical protein n=1 Tax=Mesorhizobium sp. TaxID=1871066 RepID=UPI000FE8136B|nr:hypothetical protein [Mesorhizobium sp.]RWM39946.1 MAG: hypothetical protein EOR75_12260 [Mesorhizobium sp.]
MKPYRKGRARPNDIADFTVLLQAAINGSAYEFNDEVKSQLSIFVFGATALYPTARYMVGKIVEGLRHFARIGGRYDFRMLERISRERFERELLKLSESRLKGRSRDCRVFTYRFLQSTVTRGDPYKIRRILERKPRRRQSIDRKFASELKNSPKEFRADLQTWANSIVNKSTRLNYLIRAIQFMNELQLPRNGTMQYHLQFVSQDSYAETATQLMTNGISLGSIRLRFCALRSFCRQAYERQPTLNYGTLFRFKLAKVGLPRRPTRHQSRATSLVADIRQPEWIQLRDRAMAGIVVDCLATHSELASITPATFEEARTGSSNIKLGGHKARMAKVSTDTLDTCQQYLKACPFPMKPDDCVWIGKRGSILEARSIREFRVPDAAGRPISVLELRSQAILGLADQGLPIEMIGRRLGYTNLDRVADMLRALKQARIHMGIEKIQME